MSEQSDAAPAPSVISTQDERAFWGLHEFRESPEIMGCTLCGWGYGDPIHPENVDMKAGRKEGVTDA